MRVLFVTIERPYPPVAGAELRDWQNIAAAAAVAETGVVYLTAPPGEARAPAGLALWQRLDERSAKEVWRGGGPSPADVGLSAQALAELDAALARFRPDVVVLEHTHLHRLLPRVTAAGARVVVDMHNVESHLYRQLVPPRLPLKWLHRRLFDPGVRRIRAAERALLRQADQIWLCSDLDRRRLAALGRAAARLAVVPNGVPPGRFHAAAARTAPPSAAGSAKLLFLGSLGYPPNVQAARYLARQVAPRLAAALPHAEILVAGRGPSRKLTERLESAGNLRVVADPADVAPLLRQADLMLVPLFKGGGTRLKVLEAWAAGLPVIATPRAVEGLDCSPGEDLLLARDAAGLVAAALRALEEPGLYARLSAGGLARVARQYGAERVAPLVQELLRDLAAG